MKTIIKNLSNPRFNAKGYYVLFSPLMLLNTGPKLRIRNFAQKHWDKAPTAMHRLYWTCNN